MVGQLRLLLPASRSRSCPTVVQCHTKNPVAQFIHLSRISLCLPFDFVVPHYHWSDDAMLWKTPVCSPHCGVRRRSFLCLLTGHRGASILISLVCANVLRSSSRKGSAMTHGVKLASNNICRSTNPGLGMYCHSVGTERTYTRRDKSSLTAADKMSG